MVSGLVNTLSKFTYNETSAGSSSGVIADTYSATNCYPSFKFFKVSSVMGKKQPEEMEVYFTTAHVNIFYIDRPMSSLYNY